MRLPTLKVPVVLAEGDVEVLVTSEERLDPTAREIVEIRPEIRDLSLDVVVLELPDIWGIDPEVKVKVVVAGTLHKQILWLGADNRVHHMAVNVPFSTFILFTEEDFAESQLPIGFEFDEEHLQAQVWDKEIESVTFDLTSPDTLQERVLIGFTIKLEQLTQLALCNGNQNP